MEEVAPVRGLEDRVKRELYRANEYRGDEDQREYGEDAERGALVQDGLEVGHEELLADREHVRRHVHYAL